ncbi:macrophage mannose receptor 1-like [Arctopsyche grandis]|uniref:macrophage mannose receptor 1-like n=1 Tax=Arctopsyche grandis TaxID=121162 RepID=UPI00406D7EFC
MFTTLLFVSLIGVLVGAMEQSLDTIKQPPLFRNDYNYSKELKLYYKEHKLYKNWADAVFTCTSEGASLFVPKSAEQILHLMESVSDGTNHIWVGIHDQFAEGIFVTINGASIDEVYSNWRPSEPNNVNNNENCVNIDKGGLYNDNNCDGKFRFLCEKSIDDLKNYNTQCETYDSEFFYSSKLDRCYKFHKEPMTWNSSYLTCYGEQSRLALINSQEEADLLVKLFEKYPEESLDRNFNKNIIHVGFNDFILPGSHITIDGHYLSDTGYDKWAPNQPDNRNNVEHCGSMYRNGLLNDIGCNVKAMFVCEKQITYPNKNLTGSLSAYSTDTPEFRSDYIFIDEHKAFYKRHDEAKNFVESLAKCGEEMSELYIPTSDKEIKDVASLIGGAESYMLGLTDGFQEGNFVKSDGKPVHNLYLNWNPGEPNNGGGNENCVSLLTSHTYNDIPCDLKYKFICKKNHIVHIKNHTTEYVFFPHVDVLYKFHKDIKTWYEARNICRLENATLAIPETDTEVEVLKFIFKEYPASSLKHIKNYDYIFLGFHDIFREGEFLTESGESLDYYYNKWEDKQPDNSDPGENCGSLHREGKLNDLDCNTPGVFICQQKYVNNQPKTAYHYLESLNKSYKLHTTLKLWKDARSVCSSEGGHLAIINTIEEKDFLVKILKTVKNQMKKDTLQIALMGFHDLFYEGQFITVTGEDLNTTGLTWKGGAINSATNRNCGAITDTGELSDYSCFEPSFFFCEKFGYESNFHTRNCIGNIQYEHEYDYYQNLDIYYHFHSNPRKWNHARRLCRAHNATLATPTNKDEAEALLEIFKIHTDDSKSYMHLGFHDLFSKWEYVTTEGYSIQYYYREWNAGQPDNSENSEHCVSMGRNGKLNDVSCDSETVFVCQRKAVPNFVERHNNCYSDDPGYQYEEQLHHGYKLHLNPQPWGVARSICAAEGGYLAVINDLRERDFLMKIFNNLANRIMHVKYPENALVGIHDLFEESHFTTITGEELDEAGFATWENKLVRNTERNCGSMTYSGKLDDFPCSEPAVFFCEISNWENL